jgi:hypothetical protein
MIIMYENLPFFDFFGLIEGVDSINILLYQLISFVIVFSCLMLVLKVLVVITGMVEWLLKKMVFMYKIAIYFNAEARNRRASGARDL